MRSVTFDTTARPEDALVDAAVTAGWHVAYASVSLREAVGTDFLPTLQTHEIVPELGQWNESPWDAARWGDEPSAERFEKILLIVSSGSFPKSRENLSTGYLHQFRDALILEAHAAANRDIFVTRDVRGFVGHGKRIQLEVLLQTKILTEAEFSQSLHESPRGA